MRSSVKSAIRAIKRGSSFRKSVYTATKRIPKGKVATYKDIARLIGAPGASRAVGNALNKNYYKNVPCHRVICSDGSVGGYAGGARRKIARLISEGVSVEDLKVNLKKFHHRL